MYEKQYKQKTRKQIREIFGDPRDYLGAADDIYRLKPTVYYYGY